MLHRFTRSGHNAPPPAMGSLPSAKIPARRDDAARSMVESSGKKGSHRALRSLMQAANNSRLEATWTTTPETADSIIFKNLRTLVARSRHEFLNGDYPKQFIRIIKKNVVGAQGVRLRSMPRDAAGDVDVMAKDAIEAAWKVQSRRGNWDTSGSMSRATFEQLWISTVALDGEAFALIVKGEDAGPTGFAFQMIDSMRIDPTHNAQLSDGRFIRAGIEYNKYGRPLAYHIASELSEIFSAYPSSQRERIEADRVIHAFIPELVGQKRGIPWMHTAVWRLRNLKGFEDAAVVNARVGAAKMGFVSDKNAEDDDGEGGDFMIDAEPGTFHDIGSREFKEFTPQFPETSTESFVKMQLRGVAGGLGVSYHSLANDLSSVNFSSLREGKLDERDTWTLLQEWMISSFEVRAFEEWVKYSLLAGTIRIKNKPLRLDRPEKYLAAEFKGRRWAWVDPKSEMVAAKLALDARITSRTKVIEAMHDGDAWDLFEEISREEQDMKDLGIQIVTAPGAGVMAPGANPPQADGDNEETAD